MNAVTLQPRDVSSLDDLVTRFEERESVTNPDVTVGLDALRMGPEGTVRIPNLQGEYALSEWARGQLGKLVGASLDRWFENTEAHDRADEMNRRLARATGIVRVRTTKGAPEGAEADGTVSAFVSPRYTPIPDARVAGLLRDALRGVEDRVRVVRHTRTDLSTTFVLRVGEKLTPSAEVGAVEGCIYARNSGVGFARLVVGLSLNRLACRNGLVLALPGSTLVRAIHLHVDQARLAHRLRDGLRDLPGKLHRGARQMAAATSVEVNDVALEVRDVLREARLPLRLVRPVVEAYSHEPRPTRFGISQALTLAAQAQSPEVRFELERAAGIYLAEAT
jgi:hypothetical protein